MTGNQRNYIFYVSDIDILPSKGHFSKMDRELVIANHISEGLGGCIVTKSSEYDGSLIDAESVGIVLPIHSYGVSLSVFTFLSNLKVSENTYLYVTVAGEKLMATSEISAAKNRTIKSIERIIKSKNTICMPEVYIRYCNVKRGLVSTEEMLRNTTDISNRIEAIMKGLCCYKANENKNIVQSVEYNAAYDRVQIEEHNTHSGKTTFNNVFLDEELFAGVRLCRVM